MCLNDYILYIIEYANKEIFPKCVHDRYQELKNNAKAHGPLHKISRHVPLIPRIQRIFHFKELAMLEDVMPHTEVSKELCESQ